MGESGSYSLYFECPELLPRHEKRVHRYFSNHRKSGGGECEPLYKINEGIYSISFKQKKDQLEVLKRTNHEVVVEDTLLKFTVQISVPSSPQNNPTPKGSTESKSLSSTSSRLPSSGEEHELHLDGYLVRFLKDCPKAGKWLDKRLSLLDCTVEMYPDEEKVLIRRDSRAKAANVDNWKTEIAIFEALQNNYICHFEIDPDRIKSLLLDRGHTTDEVQVYSDVGMAVVVGESSLVEARLNALQDKPTSKAKQLVWKLSEAKLRLMWQNLGHCFQRDFPNVTVTKDGGRLTLEGTAEVVLKADELISEQDKMVVERTVSDLSPSIIHFLKKAFGDPGMISAFLGFDVEIELRENELCLFSFSEAALDKTECALHREFKLIQIPVPDLDIMVYSLYEKLRPKLREINHVTCRVQLLAGSNNMMYLLGHTKEVDQLNDVVTKLILDQVSEDRDRSHSPNTLSLSHTIDFSEGSPPQSVSSPRSIQEHRSEQQSLSSFNQDEQCAEAAQKMFSLRLDEETEVVARYSPNDELEVRVCLGDITKQEADALVNSANEDLRHSGGVALALSEAGGPEVQKESSELVENIGLISSGDVVVTTGGNLKCKKLLHAVGPVQGKAGGRERILIEKAISSALDLCEIMEFRSVVVPCISSGIMGVPIALSAEAVVSAVRAFGAVGGRSLNTVTLIDNRREVVRAMTQACDRLLQDISSEHTAHTEESHQDTLEDSAGGAAAGGSWDSVQVKIIEGTIETQQVDAVVSPMLGGDPASVGESLYETTGRQLLDIFRKADEGETPGDSVLVEGLTGAPFRAVFLVHLLPWDHDPHGTAMEVLRLAVSNVLTSCENQGFSSLAFPILGAGHIFGFPEDVVAQVLLKEVHHFEQRRSSKSPFMINIVHHPGDQIFEKTFSSIQETLCHPVNTNSEPRRLVLLGKTGSGKSGLGNTIFGESVFRTDATPNSGTSKCESETRGVRGRNISVMDTPGFFDTGRPEEELKAEILNCITECAPGPHAFIIVLKVEKFSEQELAVVTKICQYFSEEALQYATVVFTHGDQLPPGTTIEQFISQSKALKKLVRKCGNRCHVIDNTYWNDSQDQYRNNQVQVEQLLKTIDKMVMENNCRFYTNKALVAVEKEIKKVEEIIRQDKPHNTPPEEIRKEAKIRVSNRFWISLAGIATGTVLGALVGVEALVRMFLKAVQKPGTAQQVQKVAGTVGLAMTGNTALAAGGVVTGLAAVGGAIAGGVIGGGAADEAESVQEAYERARTAVLDYRSQ